MTFPSEINDQNNTKKHCSAFSCVETAAGDVWMEAGGCSRGTRLTSTDTETDVDFTPASGVKRLFNIKPQRIAVKLALKKPDLKKKPGASGSRRRDISLQGWRAKHIWALIYINPFSASKAWWIFSPLILKPSIHCAFAGSLDSISVSTPDH